HEILVSVLPKDIPDNLEVDISALEIGDTVHMSDLSYPNVEIVSSPQQSVVAVTAKKIVEEETEEELEGLAEGEAGEDGEAEGADGADSAAE
ncbi:MAG: 50S ribosomal protein L25, partial [Rhodothermales bacterium]|nr:50S ribosomal protein L25 [Rhodothermales bacterium]